ncbi:adenylate/guanylate cyclase domain-containing protein [Agromyces aurantiacus]|uniref:Adenylate/guanylate cyclase domain-containing protein n=1 Tax=Agromyces aurantiacus TaxID=165814 RepID=A0ABV9R3D0_9MICO|nr:adenylate/guanylate cyclase domain-containing protein [Agromyces aurantiacus]MBM7502677.1 putative ATPase/class 3 adenylate cyclase [Agromyces aurantiacus]
MTARSRLPTGTVTFLFTDVEGSTRMAEAAGDAWPALLAEHDAVVRRAIADHRGIVVKTEGDGFFAVFASARDAVAAAADAQRALAAHEWPAGRRLRVRMGLHTGTGRLGGDDYVGLDVHRAARIAATASGGQVVLSASTAVLVERDLPDGLALRDLGEHRLRDLSQPEAMRQLDIDGLDSEFPALRTLDAVPNNLPLQVTSFVGRRDELAHAARLVRPARVLTITGAGGTGKTRLALQLGAEAGSGFRDGVFFVDLSPVHDPDLVASQIQRSLGSRAAAGDRPPRDALLEQLAEREVLLILDNFEQVIEAAPLVAELVRASPRSAFIVTSRGPLRISAEREMPLEPMQVPDATDPETLARFDAVALFLERAVSVRPDFAITEENAAAVAELVRVLDGLPLAIELVASRVRLLPVPEILARLDLAAPGAGAVDLPERQRTIEGAIAWSHDLLDEPVRRLFARLGVFAGGADLAQIERVCADPGVDVLTGLAELVDQGLLRQVAGLDRARFRTLHVIREYALARLAESGEGDDVHRRHLQAYADWAEQLAPRLLGADRKAWLDRFDADHDNVRSALDWAGVHGEANLALRLAAASWRFWQSRGHLHEGRRRLEAALALPGGAKRHRADALEALAGVCWWEGEIGRCLEPYREALAIHRELGDPAAISNALYDLGLARAVWARTGSGSQDRLEDIEPLFREAQELSSRLGDENGLAQIAWGRGIAIASLEGFTPPALEQWKASIEHYARAGNEFGLGWGVFEVANYAVRNRDVDTARQSLERGLTLFARHRDVSALVMFIALASGLARAEGDDLRAARLAGAYRALRNATGTNLVDHHINQVPDLTFEDPEQLTGELAAAFDEGTGMDLDAAVAYTLEGVRAPASGT